MASWACSCCTFLNPPTQKSACQLCLSPSSPSTITPPSAPSSSSSSSSFPQWSCRACTFINPFATRSCEVCGTQATAAPFSAFDDLALDPDDMSDPAVGSVFWPLKRCSSKRAPDGDDVLEIEPPAEKMARKEDAPAPAPSGSSFLPLQRCSSNRVLADNVVNPSMEKMLGKVERVSADDVDDPFMEKMSWKEKFPSIVVGNVDTTSKQSMLKVLSYNVWFREDLEVLKRMKALGDLIHQHTPDVICFQEVTPNIYDIFRKSNWWQTYTCSVPHKMATERPYFCMQMTKLPVKEFSCKPFSNSVMGRELCLADVDTAMGKNLLVATSHLESPCPAPPRWDQMYSKERVAQAKESISLLKGSPNVIFCGDMNWDDKLDGGFPLPDGWIDAWLELRPGENGWTYDTKANQMLSGNRKLQKRLDRFICKLRDFKISSIQMVGMDAIPGLFYSKEKKVKNEFQKLVLPVLASDHYGLLLTICSL